MIAARLPPALDLVALPGGGFPMGSSLEVIERAVARWAPHLIDPSFSEADLRAWLLKEHPRHTTIVGPFAISRFPITNAQYRAFVVATSAGMPESLATGAADDHPVWGVSHEDACRFCAWLEVVSGQRFRLPTEAEWEFAARGPSGREYPFGDEFDPRLCNTFESGIGHTTPVDRYPEGSSEWGVLDLAGNVEEWTSDLYRPYPGGSTVDDHLAACNGGSYRVLRGGSFARGGDLARCARRHGPACGPAYRFRGFRVVVPGGAVDDG